MYIVVPLINREVSRCTPTAFFDFIVVSPAVGLLFLLIKRVRLQAYASFHLSYPSDGTHR